MKYSNYLDELNKSVGGFDNISNVTHCATRLRFKFKDIDKVDREYIKELKETVGIVEANGTFQIIIGTHVDKVYEELMSMISNNDENVISKDDSKQSLLDKIMSKFSAIFTPYIPVLASAGIIKGLLALGIQVGWLTETMDIYLVLSAAGNSLIYFFPILLAYTSAKEFGANPFVGLAIGAALLEPNLTSINVTGETMNLFGLNVIAQDFSSTVIPIILAMWAYSYLEKGLKKVLPDAIQFILVPLLCLTIMVPAIIVIFGPLGFLIANGFASLYNFLLSMGPIPISVVFGALFIYVIALGCHWIVLPLQFAILAQQGYEYSLAAGGMGNYAVLGVTLAVMYISKDKNIKGLASSAAFVNFLSGITEPGLYGIVFTKKVYLISMTVAATTGGLICGIFGCYVTNFAFTGLFGIPAFASSPTAPFYFAAVVVTILLSFLLTILLSKRLDSKELK